MRRKGIFLGAFVLASAVAIPAFAQEAGAGDHRALVVISGRAYVGPGDTVGDVVVFRGRAIIEGTVDGNVVTFDAPVTISGTVTGTVTVFARRLVIEPGATVEGDVFADHPEVAPGTVQGRVHQIRAYIDWRPFSYLAWFGLWLAFAVSALALGLLILWLGPRGADATFLAARSATGPAIGWGLAIFFGLPVLAVVALVTVVGIPLGIAVLFALVLLYATGYTMSAWLLGRAIVTAPRRRVEAFLAGWGILQAVALIPWLSGLAWLAATVFGLGAMVVALWRARNGAPAMPEASAMPEAPALPEAPQPEIV